MRTPRLRIALGEEVAETLVAYREDNQIDDFPDAATKLGDIAASVSHAPIVYIHHNWHGWHGVPFSSFRQQI